MQVPTEITFRGMSPSEAVEAAVRDRVEWLSRVYGRIQHCHVSIAQPHRHKRHGRRFEVRVTVGVPGRELAITHDPGRGATHEDAYSALADAFDAARRQLQGHAQTR